MPVFDIEDIECLLETPKQAAVSLRLLKTLESGVVATAHDLVFFSIWINNDVLPTILL